MSTYPLNEPHLEALRNICQWGIEDRLAYEAYRRSPDCRPEPVTAACYDAISSPASAGALVRDLLARAGVKSSGFVHGWGGERVQFYDYGHDRFHYHEWNQPNAPDHFRVIWREWIPTIIIALASLAPGDKEGAMRALREVGR